MHLHEVVTTWGSFLHYFVKLLKFLKLTHVQLLVCTVFNFQFSIFHKNHLFIVSQSVYRITLLHFYYFVIFRFKIDDLQTEKKYLFNMKLKVCFESNGDCRHNFKVFENTRLPKVACSWNSTYINPGMFLYIIYKLWKWMDHNLDSSPPFVQSLWMVLARNWGTFI